MLKFVNTEIIGKCSGTTWLFCISFKLSYKINAYVCACVDDDYYICLFFFIL